MRALLVAAAVFSAALLTRAPEAAPEVANVQRGQATARAESLAAIVQRPVPLRDGIGRAHETVTTSSKTAQAFYDQGLAYLHSFFWIEAARSFNEALRADKGVALAHVGVSYALAELGDAAGARAAAARAQALAEGVEQTGTPSHRAANVAASCGRCGGCGRRAAVPRSARIGGQGGGDRCGAAAAGRPCPGSLP